jgi:hypothetical protein
MFWSTAGSLVPSDAKSLRLPFDDMLMVAVPDEAVAVARKFIDIPFV